MNRKAFIWCLLVFGSISVGCQSSSEKRIRVDSTADVQRTEGQEDRVRVQHILIAFKGSLPGKDVERTRQEAEAFALELYESLKKDPSSFEEFVRAHSDDQFPGIYQLANIGISQELGEFRRADMVKAFGDTAFELQPGEIAFVAYEPSTSPYGFHILIRLQ